MLTFENSWHRVPWPIFVHILLLIHTKRLWGGAKLSIKGEGLGALQFGEEAAITFPSPPEMPTRPTDCVTDLYSDSYSEHTKPSHVIKPFYMIHLFPKTSFFFRVYLTQLIL